MKQLMGDIPAELAAFVCQHVFGEFGTASFVSVDEEGDLCVSCGCDFAEARVVSFGLIKKEHPKLMQMPMLAVSTSYTKKDRETWVLTAKSV